MGIEIAFSEYNGGRNLRMEECFNKYFEAQEETEAKVDVIKIEENNNEFSNKCNSLKEYLDHYNKKYEKCFKSNIGYMYIEIRNSITQALKKCDRHDGSHTSRMREEKKLTTPDNEQHKGHPEVDNPETKTLELEKESKEAPACKDKLCEAESSGNQYLPEIKEIHEGKLGQEKDKITLGSAREVETPNTLLPANRQNTQDGAHSPTPNPPEGIPSKDSPNLETPESFEADAHPDKYPKDALNATSNPKGTSVVTGLGKDNFLRTHTSDNSTFTPQGVIPLN